MFDTRQNAKYNAIHDHSAKQQVTVIAALSTAPSTAALVVVVVQMISI